MEDLLNQKKNKKTQDVFVKHHAPAKRLFLDSFTVFTLSFKQRQQTNRKKHRRTLVKQYAPIF